MEIRSLVLVATEADLNELALKFFPRLDAIRDLRIAVVPDGIRVSGTFQKLISMHFQTLWQLSVTEGKVTARLGKVKAGVLSLGLAKPYLLDAIARATTVLELRDETLFLNVDRLLEEKGWPIRTNLTSIHCDYGSLTVKSG